MHSNYYIVTYTGSLFKKWYIVQQKSIPDNHVQTSDPRHEHWTCKLIHWCTGSIFQMSFVYPGFPGGASVKSLPANARDARDTGSTPGSGRSPGGEDGNPLQYSCLENPMDWGAWQATAHRVAKSQTWLKWLRMHTCFVYPLFNCCWPAKKTEVQHDIHCELWTQELNWNHSVYQIYFSEAFHFLLLNILYLIILITHCSI